MSFRPRRRGRARTRLNFIDTPMRLFARCIVIRAFATVFAFAAATDVAAAQDADPEFAPLSLRLPASIRAAAMGDAHVAVTDADAIFYNPALLTNARGVHVTAHRFGGASTLGTISVAMPFAPGGLGIGVQLLDHRAPCVSCDGALPSSEHALGARGPIAASGMSASLGWGRTVRGLHVGGAARYVEQRLGEQRDATAAADVGVAYSRAPFWLGLTAQGLGPALTLGDKHYDLPSRITMGGYAAPWPVGPLDLSATAAVSYHFAGDVSVGGGFEAGYLPVEGYNFVARIGGRSVPGGDAVLSFGAAATRDRFTLEYAFQPLDGPGDAHRVGLRMRP